MGLKGYLLVLAAVVCFGVGWNYSATIKDLLFTKRELQQERQQGELQQKTQAKVAAAETKQAAKAQQRLSTNSKQHDEVRAYVQTSRLRDVELDARGLCLWRAANAGIEPKCVAAQSHALPGAAAAGKRKAAGPGREPRPGRADVSPAVRPARKPPGLVAPVTNG